MSRPAAVPRRLAHPTRWIAGGLLVVLVIVAIVAATRPSFQASEADSPLKGHPAPDLAGPTLTGAHFSLGAERGRYVIVNFFAAWCPPCQAEEPDLVQFAYEQAHTPGGAAVVGVVYDDPDQDAESFMRAQGATWPALKDPGGLLASAYGVTDPPTTFVISPSGTVVEDLLGPVSVGQLDRVLAAIKRAGGAGV